MEGKEEKETIVRSMTHGKTKSDCISELPDPIIHQILSFLPPKVAARTSSLSKSWRSIWFDFPFFDFNQFYFGVDHHNLQLTKEDFNRKRDYFMNFVDERLGRLCNHNLSIKQFHLVFRYHNAESDFSCINRWLDLAAKRDVEVLKLSLFRQSSHGMSDERPGFYVFPQSVLAAAKSLTVLELHGQCKLDKSFYMNSLPFSSLRELILSWVSFADDGELIIRNIILSCPLIEDITLKFCYGLKSFHVWGLNKLKAVKVESIKDGQHLVPERVHIDAPTLHSFYYGKLTRSPCIINVEACKNVKWLTLRENCDGIFTGEFDDLFTQFPLLETLHMWHCKMPEKVKISSHRLKNLRLVCCKSLVEAEIDASELRLFDYDGDTKPSLFLVNTSSQLEVKLRLTIVNELGSSWFLSLRQFLGKLTKKIRLELSAIHCGQTTFIPEELGDISLPPVCDVGHLVLATFSPSLDLEALFDGLFWSCHPQTLSVITCSKSFLKFVKERLLTRGEEQCCCGESCSSESKCWRHSLKDVKMESFPGSEYNNNNLDTSLDVLPTPPQQPLFRFTLKW